jgi:hypothetical protein
MSENAIEERQPRLLGTVLASLTERGSTFWRALCAAVIVVLTFWMTLLDAKIPVEWETVFLLVIGYYFKDRPLEEKLHLDRAGDPPPKSGSPRPLGPEDKGVVGEMTYQFILATLLVLGAAAAFLVPSPKLTISASWIGGVVLAVGFYFKESSIESLEPWQERFRLLVALEVIAVTVPLVMLLVAKTKGESPVPLQWVAVVLIAVTFYFKERKPGSLTIKKENSKTA